MLAYLNGELVEESAAKVSIFDRGFLYGDTIYETMRTHEGRLVFWPEHETRLRRSAQLAYFECDPRDHDVESITAELLRANGLSQAVVRVTISRGLADRDQVTGYEHTWVVTARPLQMRSEAEYDAGVAAILTEIRRNAPGAQDPEVKAGSWINNLLARREARLAGAVEGVMRSVDGFVAEGASSNIFWLRDGVLETPARSIGILHGVTRDKLLGLAEGLVPMREVVVEPPWLDSASEMFLTSTGWEVLPVTRWNGRVVGTGRRGEIARELRARLRALYPKAE